MNSEPVAIGIVGCGNISDSYFKGAARSSIVRVKGCADLRREAADAKAAQHDVQAMDVDELLADPDISVVVNLTVPAAHAGVALLALDAGKHVYGEKPLAATFEAAKGVVARASALGLRVGCAPDTFLGAGHQAARYAIDEGRIGTVVSGAAAFQAPGMEMWHPNPEFFFKPGGGPVLDMGPYYVTQLVNLLGPVAVVTAVATIGRAQRTIGSEPLRGTVIDVEVPTTVHGVLQFASGANVAITTSWDVWAHKRGHMELYGTGGSMLGVNPNFFGDAPLVAGPAAPMTPPTWEPLAIDAHPFGTPNRTMLTGATLADYRIVGLLDMVCAQTTGRPHRASGDLALHVLEVLEGLGVSAASGRHVAMTTTCERPAAVPLGEGEDVFR